jgi:hypothetical protein
MGVALTLLGLAAAFSRLPMIGTPVDVLPDGCEYLAIARHLAADGRWVTDLKWQFFTDTPVVHPAIADRPPLYPLWAAAWASLSSDPAAQVWLARLGNLLLAGVLPALIYWALRAAVAWPAAALTAVVFTFYPAFHRNSAQPLTEPLFLLLLFGSLGWYLRARSLRSWTVSGLLAGVAFLTRPSGLLLPLVYVVGLWVHPSLHGNGVEPARSRSLRRRLLPVLTLISGFLAPLLSYMIAVDLQTGSPFTSVLRYNYSILDIKEGTIYGFERSFVPPAQFVWTHAGAVTQKVGAQWATMGKALARSLQFLLPLGLFWRPRGVMWNRGVLIGLAALNFIFHAMSWTVWGAARYMFPSYILGMALLLDMPLKWRVGSAARPRFHRLAAGAVALAVGMTLIACMEQDVRLFREKREPFGGVELGWAYASAGKWLARSPHGTLCAANQPWIVNLLARRPALMAPRFRDAAQLGRYVERYRPDTLTLFITERLPEDVAMAKRLVRDLWGRPRVRPEVAGQLELAASEQRTVDTGVRGKSSRVERERQALLIFRIRPSPGH